MATISFVDDEAALAEIYQKIEHRVVQTQTVRPVWPCKKGCDACCQRLAHTPEITGIEWHRLYEGIKILPEAIQAEIGQKIGVLAEREQPFVICPLLDEAASTCRVYEHRPAACRMYGFYVSRHNNQWCQQIEDLFQAGELDGAVLGHYNAMKGRIRQSFGEMKSIVAWYAGE